MRRLPVRRIAAAAVLCLSLAACGDQTDTPGPADPTSAEAATTPADATDATTGPEDDGDASEDREVTAAPETSTEVTSTAPESVASATTETVIDATPTVAPAGECSDAALSQDLLGAGDGVSVYFCEGGWAYAEYLDEQDTGQDFIAEFAGGAWRHAVFLTDPVCTDDLAARGAPPSVSKLLPFCNPEPTSEPTSGPPPEPTAGPTAEPTAPPVGDCTIVTAEYGPTRAELVGVSCEEAAAEWQVAEANADPSWTVPILTPSGWECYVTPFDPTSQAAGSCYSPDGSSSFTLYLPASR